MLAKRIRLRWVGVTLTLGLCLGCCGLTAVAARLSPATGLPARVGTRVCVGISTTRFPAERPREHTTWQTMGTYSKLNRPIVIVAYDPRWPVLYEEEKVRILAALAGREACLEHFGSTSIPGLAAKPVIDIALGAPQLKQAAEYIAVLESLGYLYAPELEAELPERRFLWRVAPGGQRYHVSLTETHSLLWERPLAFRDYLRQHPEAAAEYGQLKENLAAQSGSDIGAYVHGKTEFVKRILQACSAESR